MNPAAILMNKPSKEDCDQIVSWVGNAQHKFDALFKIFATSKNKKLRNRGGWPLSYCVENHPTFIQPYFSQIIQILSQAEISDAMKRNGLRMLHNTDIPEKFSGEIMHICFGFLENSAEKPATQAYALYILFRFSKKYPEILPEIKLILQAPELLQKPAVSCIARKNFPDLFIINTAS